MAHYVFLGRLRYLFSYILSFSCEFSIYGRRHYSSCFLQELRELTKLQGPVCLVRKDELDIGLTDASLEELKVKRPKNRIHTLLAKVK